MPKGITIIELVIVMLIVGIIAVAVTPKITQITSWRYEAASNKIKADLRFAKDYAMTNNCNTRVAFDVGSNSYTVSSDESGSWAGMKDPHTNTTPYTVSLNSGIYQGVSITAVDFSGQVTLEFDSIGRPYSYDGVSPRAALLADGTVTLADNSVITVTMETGRIN